MRSGCRPPFGAWLGRGRWGGPGARGVALPRPVPLPPLSGHQGVLCQHRSVHGGCRLHTAQVCVRAPPSGRGPGCALAYRRAAGGQVGRPAGAATCRGHCGSGRVMVLGRGACGPSGARPKAPRPPRGGWGGGGPPLAPEEDTVPTSLSRPPGFRCLGGGGGVAPWLPVIPLRWLWCMSLSTAAGGFKARPRPAPPLRPGSLARPGAGSASPEPRGHCLGGGSLSRALWRASGWWGVCGRVASCAPPCDMLGGGCLATLGAGRGTGGLQLAGQSLPSCPSVCRALLAACYGPPNRAPWRAGGRGGGGGRGPGPSSGGRCPSGEHPGPLVHTLHPPALRGPAHGAPGRRVGPRPG